MSTNWIEKTERFYNRWLNFWIANMRNKEKSNRINKTKKQLKLEQTEGELKVKTRKTTVTIVKTVHAHYQLYVYSGKTFRPLFARN